MRQESSSIRYIIGNEETLATISLAPVFPLFSDRILCFLNDLSKWLMDNDTAKKYPDVIAFSFWIRKASMEKEKQHFHSELQRIGRGVVFHITPSNIPVQFAVSLVYALVSGNSSVIRLSNKEFPQVDIICSGIRALLSGTYSDLRPAVCIIRYGHDDEITRKLSENCDARLIWGGNATIQAIHGIQAHPRCIDIGFADRYSIAVIDADCYLEKDANHLANDFYNDTYFSDQNACSSPRMVVWLGNDIEQAKERFWGSLSALIQDRYALEAICGSDKLLKTAVCAAKHPGIKQIRHDNALVRIQLPEMYEDIMDYRGNCGYFFEYDAGNLADILPVLKKECQTITYIGDNIEKSLRRLISGNSVRGVDRIVPVGQGASISFVWDGIAIPFALSRCIGNT